MNKEEKVRSWVHFLYDKMERYISVEYDINPCNYALLLKSVEKTFKLTSAMVSAGDKPILDALDFSQEMKRMINDTGLAKFTVEEAPEVTIWWDYSSIPASMNSTPAKVLDALKETVCASKAKVYVFYDHSNPTKCVPLNWRVWRE